MTPLLTAEGLSLPGRLAETALTLRPGELVCVIGPNGSGKTSLLHAIAGIGRPTGRVAIDGRDLATAPPDERGRLLSYLPAGRDIAWPISARDILTLALPPLTDEQVDSILEMMDLVELRDRRIDRLSTGERSRVLIARALVAEPKLLLFDEPTANLDPLWQLRLMDDLRDRTSRGGQAALIAIHDLDMARRHADRLIVMSGGAVAAEGAPEALLAGPLMREIFGIECADGVWRRADV